MTFTRLKFGTAVLSSLTLGLAVFYTWDRTVVKTEDIVELVEACNQRLLVVADQNGSINVTNVLGNQTNIFTVPVFNPTTNLVITYVPTVTNVGTNLYRESDGFTNYIWKHYVTNGQGIYVTNLFVSTGQYYRGSVPITDRGGREMVWHTNITDTSTNIEIHDVQLTVTANIANAIGIFNHRSTLKWIDQAIYAMVPKYLNHLKKTNGTYNSWFAGQFTSTVTPPHWTINEIFDAAGVGRSYTDEYNNVFRLFSWPTNNSIWWGEEYESDGYVPLTATNLWERYKILALCQETSTPGLTSNRFIVSLATNATFRYEANAQTGWSHDDYWPHVKSYAPWAFGPGTWYLTDSDGWGENASFMVSNCHWYVTNRVTFSTNVYTHPLAFRKLKGLFSQAYQAYMYYETYYSGHDHYRLTWMEGLSLEKQYQVIGATNGHIYRPANQNASGITGDVDVYVRDGTYLQYVTATNRCHLINSLSNVDGGSVCWMALSCSDPDPGILSLIRTNASEDTQYTNGIYAYWEGPYITNFDFSAAILSGPMVTKWNFTRCIP